MKIDFYLTNYGFVNDDLLDYLQGLVRLVAEVGTVVKFDPEEQDRLTIEEKKKVLEDRGTRISENRFWVCEEVLYHQFNGKSLFEWCYDQNISEELRTALTVVLQSAHNKTNVSIGVSPENFASLKTKLRSNNEISASALLGMEKSLVGLTRYGVVFDIRSWLELRYCYWCYYVKDPILYKKQCLLYFFNLLFAETAFDTIHHIYPDCRLQITKALKSLDTIYYSYLQQGGNNNPNKAKMKWLESASGQTVTPEGSGGSDRIDANFKFPKDDGGEMKLFCSNHFKFYYDDNKKNFSQNRRLYFHDPVGNVGFYKKILIGHIGIHL